MRRLDEFFATPRCLFFCALLFTLVSLTTLLVVYPDLRSPPLSIGVIKNRTLSYVAEHLPTSLKNAGVVESLLTNIINSEENQDEDEEEENDDHRLKTIHETSCERFFAAAQCWKLLDAKGAQHHLPTLDLPENFHDYRRVLLIVHFNGRHYDSAAKVYAIYYRLFAKIIFCGPSENETEFWPHSASSPPDISLPRSVPFVPFGAYNGAHRLNPYICLPMALRKVPGNYSGVLLMSDDVVLNYWNWKRIGKSLDKVWAIKEKEDSFFDIDSGNFCIGNSTNNTADCLTGGWMWPGINKNELLAFYDSLSALANGSAVSMADPYVADKNESQWTNYWREIKENLTKATKGERRLLGNSNGDMFFVGKDYLNNIAPLMTLLGRNHVFLEIAVVTALRTVASNDDVQPVSFDGEDYGQGQIRSGPFIAAYKTSYEMVHPFKLSKATAYLSVNNSQYLSAAQENDVSTSCVYCNLIKMSAVYADFIKEDDEDFQL